MSILILYVVLGLDFKAALVIFYMGIFQTVTDVQRAKGRNCRRPELANWLCREHSPRELLAFRHVPIWPASAGRRFVPSINYMWEPHLPDY